MEISCCPSHPLYHCDICIFPLFCSNHGLCMVMLCYAMLCYGMLCNYGFCDGKDGTKPLQATLLNWHLAAMQKMPRTWSRSGAQRRTRGMENRTTRAVSGCYHKESQRKSEISATRRKLMGILVLPMILLMIDVSHSLT